MPAWTRQGEFFMKINAAGDTGSNDSGDITEKAGDSVRAVERALDILMAFTAADAELSVADLLKRVELSRPTLYRLIYTLEKSGFLVSEGEPQKFRLGASVGHLAHVWTASMDIGVLARPILRRLWEQTGETVALFVPQGRDRLCVAELPSLQPLSFKRGVGYRERIVLGASGRAILAHADVDAGTLQAYAEGTGVDLTNYPAAFALIRAQGYATSSEELLKGAMAIAAPFFDNSGKVAGSIAVFGPSVRLDRGRVEVCAKLLVEAAGAMSLALGKRSGA